MKLISSQLAYFFQNRGARRNIEFLVVFIVVLVGMIISYSILFHFIMMSENQYHSWVTGFYWTLTVMSTLGFGDITFTSDLGRVFSIIVLISGVVFLLILLPFTFIQFFYAPWIDAQNKARAPKELPEDMENHIILTSFSDISIALIEKLRYYNKEYVLIIEDMQKALELFDIGYRVALGAIDDPNTYKRMRVEKAALVFADNSDQMNSNVAFTIREITDNVPIITTADSPNSVDILELAGSNFVLEPRKMIGESIARRTIGSDAISSRIGKFENLVIAEAPAQGTPLVGKTLLELELRRNFGINVIGFWEHGNFVTAHPDFRIKSSTVIVFAGTEDQIERYDEMFVIFQVNPNPVIIVGSGRVGVFVANNLKNRDIDFVFVEKENGNIAFPDKTIIGNAADFEVLKKAGLNDAHSIIISTNDDPMNIYLSIYCRRLRPDIQIISRANLDKNVSTLHRAGADIIISYPSLSANAVFNYIRQERLMMLSEGIDIFQVKTPQRLVGLNLIQSNIRKQTGCSVIGVKKEGIIEANPDPSAPLDSDSELLLVGSIDQQKHFFDNYIN